MSIHAKRTVVIKVKLLGVVGLDHLKAAVEESISSLFYTDSDYGSFLKNKFKVFCLRCFSRDIGIDDWGISLTVFIGYKLGTNLNCARNKRNWRTGTPKFLTQKGEEDYFWFSYYFWKKELYRKLTTSVMSNKNWNIQ